MRNGTPTQAELLAHYKRRQPKPFIQFDGFDLSDGSGDDIMRPDEDGHCIMSSETYELMSGVYTVRVLAPHGADAQVVARMLHKIAGSIEPDSRSNTSEPEFIQEFRQRVAQAEAEIADLRKALAHKGRAVKALRESLWNWEQRNGMPVSQETMPF